jgi:outer membrane protein assembly factor BamB
MTNTRFKNLWSRTSVIVLLVVCSTLATSGWLWANDWPQWRGPNRDGKAAGFNVPEVWPKQLVQKWKVTVGVGDSTPALVGGKLYTFGRQGEEEVLQCLDASTGNRIWENSYAAGHVVTGPPARHPGTRSSPAVADGRIYALGVGGILSCLDTSTGKVAWRKQSKEDYQGIPYQNDTAMSPIIVDGLCVVHVGGKTNGALFAFNAASGDLKWKWDGDGPAFSSPGVLTARGTKQLVTLTAKSVVGLSLAEGKLLWQIPFEAAQGNNTTPVIDGQTVIYTGQGKGMFAVKIEPQGETFAAVPIWTNSELGGRFTTPILKGDLLFGYHGHFFCADAKTGATLWADTTNRGNSAALVDAGQVIVATTVNSELVAFKPSEKQYTELARIKVADTETWAHPVVDGDRVYVRDRENVTLWTIQ